MKIFSHTISHMRIGYKITLSALILALVVIFNKVLAINYISFVPFVRISFGSIALLVFASIAIGPIYGLFIGAFADVIGYFIFDMSSFGWFPQITATYALLGFVPYFIFLFIKYLKNVKVAIIVEYSLFGAAFLGVLLFFIFANSITLYGKTYDIELYQRFLVPGLTLLFFGTVVLVNYLISKRMRKNTILNIYQISLLFFIVEVLVNLLFGSLMKAWAFGFDMLSAIFVSQLVVMFFNIPYNSYLMTVILSISERHLRKDEYVD